MNKKLILRIVFILLALVVVIIGAGVFVAFRYQKEAKAFVISKVNAQLATELLLNPDDIDFSVLKHFPRASIDIKNVHLLDAVDLPANQKDTLLSAGLVSFQFSLKDLYNKHYTVKRILIKDVQLKIWKDKAGRDNFHILKTVLNSDSAAQAQKDTSTFELDKLQFQNVHLQYKDAKLGDAVDVLLKKANIEGKFNSQEYTLKSDLNVFINSLVSNKTEYIQKREIDLVTDLDVSGTRYRIKKANFHLEKLALGIAGTIDLLDTGTLLNLSIDGKNMDIQAACSWLPGKFKTDIAEFESKGSFYFHGTVAGVVGKNKLPIVVVTAGIKDGEIHQTKEHLKLKNIDLQLECSNAGKGKLNVSHFSGALPEGKINGNLSLENFSDPVLNAQLEGVVDLSELQKFLRIDTIESISGKLAINASFKGAVRKSASDYLKDDQTNGTVNFSDVNLRLRNNNLKFDGFNGAIRLSQSDLEITAFDGKVSDNDFHVDGTFKNLLGWFLIKDEALTANVNVTSKKMDLNELLSSKSAPVSKDNPSYQLNLSNKLDLTVRASIGKLIFRKFEGDNLDGTLSLKNQVLSISPLKLNAMDGSISTQLTVDAREQDSVRVSCEADGSKLNVTKLFEEMENFGQETLTDKNVKGAMTVKSVITFDCAKDLTINTQKLEVASDLTIENGELIHFKSLQSLSKFISMKELDDIHFASLSTPISIKNRIITLPETQVNSSVLDLEVSGTQDFDENVDYVFGLYLSELLALKAKERKKENSDFSEQDSEGKHKFRLYVAMQGNLSNPSIHYDHKAAKAKRKEIHKAEKERLKAVLSKV